MYHRVIRRRFRRPDVVKCVLTAIEPKGGDGARRVMDAAIAALEYITECESTGDFEDFSPEPALQQAREFYGLVEPDAPD
jgi:hypothetical protein